MLMFIKQMLVGLLSFYGSLATKYVPWNNQPCMTNPTLVDLYPDDLHYNPFIIRLDFTEVVIFWTIYEIYYVLQT